MSFVFNDEILKILFKIIVKIFIPFVLKRFIYLLYHIMIVPYNALLYLALIKALFFIGAIVKPN